MADLNQDLMTAKVPHWFTRLSGWEARLVALKADIALVFGVKPDTKDGDACMKAIEQVILDFLENITARPDRKINKGLMTAVEAELEQAKLTISNLKDTQMRQEIILRQYAEESKYHKDAVVRRDASMGMQRSQLLREILHLKSEITRLETASVNAAVGNAGHVNTDGATARSTHTATPNVAAGGAPPTPAAKQPVEVLSNEERRTIIKLQSEIRDVRREAERLMDQVNALNLQNETLSEQMEQMQTTHHDEMQEIVSTANNRITELEQTVEMQRQSEHTCLRCLESIEELVCAKCFAASIKQAPETPQTPSTQATPLSPATATPAPQAGPARSVKGKFASKARLVGQVAIAAAVRPISGSVDGSLMIAPSRAAAPPAASQVPPKKKTWSFERDVQAWQEHCEKQMAEEREDFKAQLQQKDVEIEEIMQAALKGRLEVVEQVATVERNFWETQMIALKQQQANLSKEFRRLCEDVAEDLEDLAHFIEYRKIPWVTEKEGQSKTNEEFTAFIHKQIETIKGLRKEQRLARKRMEIMHLQLEADRKAVAEERSRSENELFDLRSKVFDSDAIIQRLQFQISQLEGSEVSGRTREQSKRLEKIKSFDNQHVSRRRDELSKSIHPLPAEFSSELAVKIDGTVRHLRTVFDASLLENQEEGSNNGDGNGDTSPRSIASAQSPHVSSPVSTQAFKLSQLDPMKLKMENTQLKKLIRRYKDRAIKYQDTTIAPSYTPSEASPMISPCMSRTSSSAQSTNVPPPAPSLRANKLDRSQQPRRSRSKSPTAKVRSNSGSPTRSFDESDDEMGSPINVTQRNLKAKPRDLCSIPGSPLDATTTSPYTAVGHQDTMIGQPAGSGPGYSNDVSPKTKALAGQRRILRSYAGGEYFDDDDDGLQVIGAVDKATQTSVAWQRERRENSNSTGRGMVKGGSGEEQSRDALLAGMLPSMNLMVVPMKSSKGALKLQPQAATAFQLPEQALFDIYQRNTLSLYEPQSPSLQRPQSARTSRPSTDAHTGSESSREPLQGRGFSRRISDAFSIEIVKEPKPPPPELTVEGVQSVKRHRGASASPFARRLMAPVDDDAASRELKIKEIKINLLASQHAAGAENPASPSGAFPVRGTGFAIETPGANTTGAEEPSQEPHV